MYFITKKNSDTGKKFAEVEKKLSAVRKARKALMKKMKVKQWRGGYWVIDGGVSALIFEEGVEVDKKVYKNVNGSKDEWMPRLNTKEGKAIQRVLDELPTLSIDELNQCVGFKRAPFKHIGFDFGNRTYYGFTVKEEWNLKIPSDCTEVTTAKYKSLFKD